MSLRTRTTESYCWDCLRIRLSLPGVTHALNKLVLREGAALAGIQPFGTGGLRLGLVTICLCRTGGLRVDDFIRVILWNRRCSGDQFLHGGSAKHSFRYKQHADLDGNGSNEYCHYAGDIYIHIGERLNEHEPVSDDHLHADCYECPRLDHVHGEGHCSSVRWSFGDRNYFVPRRNTRRGL